MNKTAFLSLVTALVMSVFTSVASAQNMSLYSAAQLALGVGHDAVIRTDDENGSGSGPGSGSTTADNGISQADYDRVGENMFRVQQALNSKHTLSDNISLGMYVLRFLSDLGEFSVPHKDIMILLEEVKRLQQIPDNDPDFNQLRDFLDQFEKIRFGERNGKKYAKIYTKNVDGIEYAINEPGTGALKEIKFLKIKNGARIYFSDLDTKKEEKWLKRFIKNKVRFFLIAISALNQIYEPIRDNINEYIGSVKPVAPLYMKFSGVFVRVITDTIFGKMDFHVKKAVSLPGITNGQEGLPSFVGEARSGLVKVKVSIDQ